MINHTKINLAFKLVRNYADRIAQVYNICPVENDDLNELFNDLQTEIEREFGYVPEENP